MKDAYYSIRTPADLDRFHPENVSRFHCLSIDVDECRGGAFLDVGEHGRFSAAHEFKRSYPEKSGNTR